MKSFSAWLARDPVRFIVFMMYGGMGLALLTMLLSGSSWLGSLTLGMVSFGIPLGWFAAQLLLVSTTDRFVFVLSKLMPLVVVWAFVYLHVQVTSEEMLPDFGLTYGVLGGMAVGILSRFAGVVSLRR